MKISEATDLSIKYLKNLGFNEEESELITRNLIAAELVEKKSHGLIRLPVIKQKLGQNEINVSEEKIEVIKERKGSLLVDSKNKPGFIALYKSLDIALNKVKNIGILGVAIKDLGYASGYIGDYARMAAEHNLVFIGMHNSPGRLVPYGTVKDLWGTNPLTIGIPAYNIPIILDMASSKITLGDLLIAKNEKRKLAENVAIDQAGNPTIDPASALLGGLLPISGHKGSGLAFVMELLAGGLSNSRVGRSVQGGWGSFYLLIDPEIFRDINDFKQDVQTAIDELKSVPKSSGTKEVYFPGEQSFLKRKRNIELDNIEINDDLLSQLT